MKKILLVGASGYIGSRVAHDLSKKYKIIGCDLQPTDHPSLFSDFHLTSYQKLSQSALDCDVVLWFAGHSSVKSVEKDTWGALQNNVYDLAEFLRRCSERKLRVFYASSASVCSSLEGQFSRIATEESANAYDASKLALDVLLKHIGTHIRGLRLATVCGWSPTMRWDTVFNAMNHSAKEEGEVRVTNASNFRSLLFIDDLVQYLLHSIEETHPPQESSIQPLASWSGSIGTVAAEIADFWRVPIRFLKNHGTYSFVISDNHLRDTLTTPEELYMSFRQRCKKFATQHQWETP
jgi:nucleoside-diphosphate-sugar epimerase